MHPLGCDPPLPMLIRDLCYLTPKHVSLVTFGSIRANVNHSGSPRLLRFVVSEPLSSPFITCLCQLSLPMCFQSNDEITKEFWLSIFHFHRYFTSNIPSSARLPPRMFDFRNLLSNQSKSHCNALLVLLWAGNVC